MVIQTQIKQIAGRAGRRNSLFPVGEVTTFRDADMHFLVSGLKKPIDNSTAAGLMPVFEQVSFDPPCFCTLSCSHHYHLSFGARWNFLPVKFQTTLLLSFWNSKGVSCHIVCNSCSPLEVSQALICYSQVCPDHAHG